VPYSVKLSMEECRVPYSVSLDMDMCRVTCSVKLWLCIVCHIV
jgi:hypothetical protein